MDEPKRVTVEDIINYHLLKDKCGMCARGGSVCAFHPAAAATSPEALAQQQLNARQPILSSILRGFTSGVNNE